MRAELQTAAREGERVRAMTRRASAMVGLVALAAPVAAVLPDDVAPGTRARVKGSIEADGRLVARDIELRVLTAGRDELEGRIEAVDPRRRTLRVVGVQVVLESDARLRDADGEPLELRGVRRGQRATLEGSFAGGVFRARTFEVKDLAPDEARRVELRGLITEVDGHADTFRILGVEVQVASETRVELD